MADFTVITPRLATGAAIQNVSDVDAIVAAGVTAVIDCRDDFDDLPLLAPRPELLYLWNGAPDDGKPKPPAWFAASLTFALPLLAKPGQLVLCHCSAGVNRGPSTVYAIMRAVGFAPGDALGIIRTLRPAAVDGIRYAPDADAAIASLGYGSGKVK